MTPQEADLVRLAELSIDEALGELSAEEAEEYAQLHSRYADFDAALSQRAIVAAIHAMQTDIEPLPEQLEARIEGEAARYFTTLGETRSENAVATLTAPSGRARSRRKLLLASGGWLAAAASLVFALSLWLFRAEPSPPTHLAAAEDRASLLASGRTLLKAAWAAGGDPSGTAVQGDVVWDPVSQVGYMRFVGLKPNNPSQEQYQLWIFDSARDERYPVDGGVFDIGADGEVVVKIRSALPVTRATLFAITVEKPGGVVVSSRARIAALARAG